MTDISMDLGNVSAYELACEAVKILLENKGRSVTLFHVSDITSVTDYYKVIKYGSYTINLKDKEGNIIQSKDNVTAGNEETGITNETIKFTGLKSNTQYIIEITYDTYRNNVGFTPSQKEAITPFTDVIYTPISNGITLGTITASASTAKEVILTYTG